MMRHIRKVRQAGRRRFGRRAFSLLEVMIASAILVVTMAVVVRIQTQSVTGALRAQKVVVGTNLAQEKMGEVLLLIEMEGIGTQDIYERGDFDDFGDEQRLDFGDELEDYHWEYWVEEIEFALSSDVMGFLGGMGGEDDAGGGAGGPMGAMAGADAGATEAMMSQLGLGQDQLTEQLGNFIRRVRIRVYWGEESEAEERGREVVITTHIISPEGAFRQMGGDPNNPGGNGAPGGPGGMPGAGAGGRGGRPSAPGVPSGIGGFGGGGIGSGMGGGNAGGRR